MESLKDLTNFLKTQSSGASMGELKAVFNDEAELKKFIKLGLDNGVILKEGEKRGTRYFVGSISKKTDREESSDFVKATTDVEVYLQSDKPCIGNPYIVKVTKIGEPGKTIKQFLESGVIIKGTIIGYNRASKRNEVVFEDERYHFNKISFSVQDRKFIFTKFFAENAKQEQEVFQSYDEFREFIRASLT